MTGDHPARHTARGVIMTVVFGPVLAVGVIVAASALLSSFIAGWIPSRWGSGSPADWLVGGGVAGDAINYVRFMIGGLLAAGSWAAIRWGFSGGKPDVEQRRKSTAFLADHEKRSVHEFFEHTREADETAIAWVATRSSDTAGVKSGGGFTTPYMSPRGVLFLTNQMLWFCSVNEAARGYHVERIEDASFDVTDKCLTIRLTSGKTIEFEGGGDLEDYRRIYEQLRASGLGS